MDPVAKKVARDLQHRGVPIEFNRDCVLDIDVFSDGELCTTIKPNVRDKVAFLFWDFMPKNFDGEINIRIQELELALKALEGAQVAKIILVCPYLPYTRQERPMRRQPLSAKQLAQKLSKFQKLKHLVTFDLHAPQIAGFFDDHIEVINVPAHVIFAPFFRKEFTQEIQAGALSFLATDMGGSKRGRNCAEKTGPGLDIAIVDKRRDNGESRAIKIVGDVSKTIIVYDDIGGTMGSLLGACVIATEGGAKNPNGAIAHNVLSPKKVPKTSGLKKKERKSLRTAEAKIADAGFPVYTLDTLPRGKKYYKKHPLIRRVPYEKFMAALVMELIVVDGSVGTIMDTWAAS
jgi:ribose-phosphate pyrophosphokinase